MQEWVAQERMLNGEMIEIGVGILERLLFPAWIMNQLWNKTKWWVLIADQGQIRGFPDNKSQTE